MWVIIRVLAAASLGGWDAIVSGWEWLLGCRRAEGEI